MAADHSPDKPSPPESASQPAGPPAPNKWEKADILLKGIATPITVALVGLFTSSFLNEGQVRETSYRAFAELTARREEADTKLREEMFKTVLTSFLNEEKKGKGGAAERILKLEILAYNFHESLDLGPVFQDVFREIQADSPEMERLKRVATQVILKQVEALRADVGTGMDMSVDFDDLDKNGVVKVDKVMSLRLGRDQQSEEHPKRLFHVEVISQDQKRKELTVRLIVSRPGNIDPAQESEVDIAFNVGFFDFPSIDNTRLSRGERCAVVLTQMEKHSARIGLVYFPANRASLKDRMYTEELLHEMLHIPRREEEGKKSH